eukprot:6198072-Pleurochrysis_carterae.AAC.3
MAEPAHMTESEPSHSPTVPGHLRRRERIRVGGGPDKEGVLTPRARVGVASAPLPRRPPRGQCTGCHAWHEPRVADPGHQGEAGLGVDVGGLWPNTPTQSLKRGVSQPARVGRICQGAGGRSWRYFW